MAGPVDAFEPLTTNSVPWSPPDPEPGLGTLFGSSWKRWRMEGASGEERDLAEGYAPIVGALGLDALRDNPYGPTGRDPMDLSFDAMRPRMTEEQILQRLEERRRTQPDFLPGVPKTIPGLRQSFKDQAALRYQKAGEVSGRATSVLGHAATLAGGLAAGIVDEPNQAALAVPMAFGSSIWLKLLTAPLVQGSIEAAQQPHVAKRVEELGEKYTASDFGMRVGSAAAGGLLFQGAGEIIGHTPDAVRKLFPQWARARDAKGFGKAMQRAIRVTDLGSTYGIAFPKDDLPIVAIRLMDPGIRGLNDADAAAQIRREIDAGTIHDRVTAQVYRETVPDHQRTPEERVDLDGLERSADAREANPKDRTMAGDQAHQAAAANARERITDDGAPTADERVAAGGRPRTGPLSPNPLTRDRIINFVQHVLEGGGKVVDNQDGGGITKYGITSSGNPDLNVRDLTAAQAAQRAHERYWLKGLDDLDPRLAAVIFDANYMSPPGVARRILRESNGDWERALELYRQRLNHVADTAPGKAGFKHGWNNRVDRLEAFLRDESGMPAREPGSEPGGLADLPEEHLSSVTARVEEGARAEDGSARVDLMPAEARALEAAGIRPDENGILRGEDVEALIAERVRRSEAKGAAARAVGEEPSVAAREGEGEPPVAAREAGAEPAPSQLVQVALPDGQIATVRLTMKGDGTADLAMPSGLGPDVERHVAAALGRAYPELKTVRGEHHEWSMRQGGTAEPGGAQAVEPAGARGVERPPRVETAANDTAKIFDDVHNQLLDAGVDPEVARQHAALVTVQREAMAERFGQTPLEYHQANPMEWRRGADGKPEGVQTFEQGPAPGEPGPGDPEYGRDSRISTRLPTTKGAKEDPFAATRLVIDLAAMKFKPEAFAHNMGLMKQYPGLKTSKRNPDALAEEFTQRIVANLLWLHDRMPAAQRARAKLWYDGARKLVDRWQADFGHSPETIAGVIAALSPQKGWYENVSLAERILDIWQNRQAYKWDARMEETAQRIYAGPKNAPYLADIRGKTLGEIDALDRQEGTKDILRAMWIRTHDQAHNPAGYRFLAPEGHFIGEPQGNIRWQTNNGIAKAVSVLRDPSPTNISLMMGEANKVRSFYNNIIAPHAPDGDVTIDTHAVAAGLLRALASSDTEVFHAFGTAPYPAPADWVSAKNINGNGAMGTYGLFADAYRRAAAQRGILPREMQSITWEAVRGLFTDRFKRGKTNKGEIDAIWKDYDNGKLTLDEAREAVVKRAGGIDPPSWHGPTTGEHARVRDTSYEGELSGARLSGRDPEGLGRGDGGGAPAGGPPGVEPRALEQAGGGEGPRGRITIDDGKAVVELFQKSDPSTIIHETGHAWLEELRRHTTRAGLPEDVRADWETLKTWWGENGHVIGEDGVIPTGAHEDFARAFEQYMMEGKAPNQALARVFESFKDWLTQIYRTVRDLDVPLDDRIRGVFDRMLGTDEARDLRMAADTVEGAGDGRGLDQALGAGEGAPAGIGAEAPGVSGPGELRGGAGLLEVPPGQERGADRAGAPAPGDDELLPGSPASVQHPERGTVAVKPTPAARQVARAYMESRGLHYEPPDHYVKLDPERSKRIADEYEAMADDPTNPETLTAYQALIDETLAQYQAIKATGLKIEMIPQGAPDPYAGGPRDAVLDVQENNHLWVYPTDSGFGTDPAFSPESHPLYQMTDEVLDGKQLRANDVFRIVHDYFGHVKDGHGFRATGEENAFQSHAAMYTPEARRAMAAETRGQNSWVNYGPEGEANRVAKTEGTEFAKQKVGLLPEWVTTEGAVHGEASGTPKEAAPEPAAPVEPAPVEPAPAPATRPAAGTGEPDHAGLEAFDDPDGAAAAEELAGLRHDMEMDIAADPEGGGGSYRLDEGDENVTLADVRATMQRDLEGVKALEACLVPGAPA